MPTPMKQHPILEKEALYRAYVEENRTPRDIAREANVSAVVVYNRLKKHDIPLREQRILDRETLSRLYVDEGKTFREIAPIVGFSDTQVKFWARKYNIQRRTKLDYAEKVDPSKEWLLQEHASGCGWEDIRKNLGMKTFRFYSMLKRMQISKESGEDRVIDVNKQKRNSEQRFSEEQRRLIFERDQLRCQMPGCRHRNQILDIHHIVAVRHGGETICDNGIVICRACHASIRKTEQQYIQLFQSIVAINNARVQKVLYAGNP